jgi:predicted AAA+ superfamily ATPase
MISLPDRVGSPLSINSLREDLGVSHRTVEGWVRVFERLFAVFRLAPFGAPRLRAVKKEKKHYHLDWTLVQEEGPRFENLVACHLLKWVHFEQDTKGRDLDLRYFRDTDGREVDFVVVEGKKPILLVEAKAGDTEPDKSLRYMKERFKDAEAWQISARGTDDYQTPLGIRVAPAVEFLKTLA